MRIPSEIGGGEIRYPAYMGILNLTPDSFSDGGEYDALPNALLHAKELSASGAAVLDLGAESTRPGFTPISASEETARLLPVLREIRRAFPQLRLSVDTTKSDVARAALHEGAWMINDISGGLFDSKMFPLAAQFGSFLCLGHIFPEGNLHSFRSIDDIFVRVFNDLKQRRDAALYAGVRRERIFLDPGIGFGKNAEQNLILLERIGEFRQLGCRLLVGVSRKRFLGGTTLKEKDALTAKWTQKLFDAGVDLVRVHRIERKLDAAGR